MRFNAKNIVALGFIVLIILVTIYFNLNYKIHFINYDYMNNSYVDGDKIIVSRSYENLNVDDVILVESSIGPVLAKIVAFPGSIVEETEQGLLIDGKMLDYDFTIDKDPSKYILESDQFYVLSENTQNYHDSRNFGVVTRDKYIGSIEGKE